MYNAAAETKEKLVKVWLRESVFTLRKSKDLAGYSNNTNSEFEEFLLHRLSSVSTPDVISNKRQLEEISSDDINENIKCDRPNMAPTGR